MPVWLQPGGPLNYRQVEELIAWLTASKDTTFTYEPPSSERRGGPAPTAVARSAAGATRPTRPPPAHPAARLLAQPQRPDRWRRWRSDPASAGCPSTARHGGQAARHHSSTRRPASRSPMRRAPRSRASRSRRARWSSSRSTTRPVSTTTSTSATGPICRRQHGQPTRRAGLHERRADRDLHGARDGDGPSLQFACTLPGHYRDDARRPRPSRRRTAAGSP